ncbi:MAG TPA: RDD family protein [Chloroflexota bacterium]|nr:RDD family protein [Chloroflexota bacterium]
MASAEYSVLTPERVSLQYDIAGMGSRGAAAIIDSLIQLVVLFVILAAIGATALIGSVLNVGRDGPGAAILLLALYVLAVFAVTFGYYMLFEIVWSGQTPGKRALGVRVIRENGYPIRPVDAVIRNLVRIVDWLPATYGVGLIAMLLNKRSKRLGDFAAGTLVVREGPRSSSRTLVMPVVAAEPTESRGYALSTSDATLVRDFLTRRGAMNLGARADLAQRLATAVSSRYGLPLAVDPETFLERLNV